METGGKKEVSSHAAPLASSASGTGQSKLPSWQYCQPFQCETRPGTSSRSSPIVSVTHRTQTSLEGKYSPTGQINARLSWIAGQSQAGKTCKAQTKSDTSQSSSNTCAAISFTELSTLNLIFQITSWGQEQECILPPLARVCGHRSRRNICLSSCMSTVGLTSGQCLLRNFPQET